jgi:hypothetical protein
MNPVPWSEIEAASGPPSATEVEAYVEELGTDVRDRDAYEAVKTVYDEWKTDLGEDRQLPDQGAAFVIAYLLEREGLVDLSDAPQGSLVERQPETDRLRELFWEREQTMWWMAVELGVHYSLVTFWLWEADVPLAERNLSDETIRRIAVQTGDDRDQKP